MRERWWLPAAWLGLGATLLVTAYLLINTTFMLYDDEGYVLITYQQFNAGGRLYADIFTQYGPWPYLYHWLAGALFQTPVTHAVGRALTAGHWVLAVLLAGALAGRLSGSRMAAFTTSLVTFGLLWQMSSEPSHPGGLIVATLAVSAWLAVAALQGGHEARLGTVLGLAAALLLLTKVNVGLLFAAGAGCALLHLTDWPARWRRGARALGWLGLLAVPWGLMGTRLTEPWVCAFAILTTTALAGVLWLQPSDRAGGLTGRTWIAAGAAFLAALAGVTLILVARGTAPGELFEAVLVAPLRHPASFMVGLHWPAALWPVAIAAGGLVFRAGHELRTRGGLSELTRRLVLAFRLTALFAFVAHAHLWPTLAGVSRFLAWSLPLLPVFLIPARPAPGATGAGPLFLSAALALPQIMHAYPVAGSQMGWGTFLLMPLFAWGLHDAWLALGGYAASWLRRLVPAAWSLLLLVGAGQLGLLLHTGWTRYHTARPVDLPGAADLRPGDGARLTLRLMTLNAAVHADVLFSYPGMYSYNLWSAVPTPTMQNATHWFWLLDDHAQRRIIHALQASPRSAIVSNRGFDDYLLKQRVPSHGPLRPLLETAYRPLVHYGHFQFLVPAASAAVPFGTAELLVAGDGGAADYPALLRTNVVLKGRPARFRLLAIAHPWTVHDTYAPPGSRILLEPISSQGRTLGPALALPLTHDVQGLYRVNLYLRTRPDLSRPGSLVLTCYDDDGAVLSESVF